SRAAASSDSSSATRSPSTSGSTAAGSFVEGSYSLMTSAIRAASRLVGTVRRIVKVMVAGARSHVSVEIASRAYVLRTRPYGELDLIATLLTETHGKVTGIAKAAKHSRRRFGGTLEPFVHVRAVFRQRPHGDLVFFVRCELLQALRTFVADIDRF